MSKFTTTICAHCSKPFAETVDSDDWQVNKKPTCWNCYSEFAESSWQEQLADEASTPSVETLMSEQTDIF